MKYGEEQSLVETGFKKTIVRLLGCTHLGERSRHNYLMDAVQMIPLPERAQVLNAGSANGSHSFYLAQKFPRWHITGIEIDPEMVKRSLRIKERLRLTNVDFAQQDIQTFADRDRFDLIFCISVLQYIRNQEQALSRLYCSLKPDGYLILNAPSMPRPPRLPFLKNPIERYQPGWAFGNDKLSFFITKAGFKMIKLYNPSGIFAQLAWELSRPLKDKPKLKMVSHPFLLFLIYLDKLQKNKKPFPAGTDCMVIARK